MTLCLAQAYQSAGDYGMARQELERLLSENTRDTQLLNQLSKLAEAESDVAAAVKYQEQLAKLAPGAESEYRLATLLSRSGDNQEAAAILVRLASKENDRGKLLRNIDSLLTSGQEETALTFSIRRSARTRATGSCSIVKAPRWRSESGRSGAHFTAILSQSLADEELSTLAKLQQQRRGAAGAAAPVIMPLVSTAVTSYSGPLTRLVYAAQVRVAVGAEADRYYSVSTRAVWVPQTFGQARAWRPLAGSIALRTTRGERTSLSPSPQRDRIADGHRAQQWDWLYLMAIQSEADEMRSGACRLAEMGDRAGQGAIPRARASRNLTLSLVPAIGQAAEDHGVGPGRARLGLRCYQAVQRGSEGQPQIASRFAVALMAELRPAGRSDEADRLYQETMKRPETPRQLSMAILLATETR